MFNKKPEPAGSFWRAGIGVPATCNTSLAQEQCKSHKWIIKTSMAHGRWDATNDWKVFGSQLSSQISQERMKLEVSKPSPFSCNHFSHTHPTLGFNSVYKNKQRVKSCTWECHYLGDSPWPKFPILQPSREMWCPELHPRHEHTTFPGCWEGSSSIPGFSPQEPLLLICKQQNNTGEITVYIKFKIQAAALATWST